MPCEHWLAAVNLQLILHSATYGWQDESKLDVPGFANSVKLVAQNLLTPSQSPAFPSCGHSC